MAASIVLSRGLGRAAGGLAFLSLVPLLLTLPLTLLFLVSKWSEYLLDNVKAGVTEVTIYFSVSIASLIWLIRILIKARRFR